MFQISKIRSDVESLEIILGANKFFGIPKGFNIVEIKTEEYAAGATPGYGLLFRLIKLII